MSRRNAVKKVANFIKESDMYNFKSLADETQNRLLKFYGISFENEVNTYLDIL